MYDPMTVAHEIRYPWRAYWKPKNDWERGYHAAFITIWHVDPEKNLPGMVPKRGDDTCGWHRPPLSEADLAKFDKMLPMQYSELFERQRAIAEKHSWVNITSDADCHAAIYWLWRAIKREFKKKDVWQYGRRLTSGERDAVYDLATCPVDNLKHLHTSVKDEETFREFALCVFNAFRRYHRPWWRHPRWHIHHWKIQIHPWQTLRRWLFTRCASCGKRFSWGYSPVSHSWDSKKPGWFQGEQGLHHANCAYPESDGSAQAGQEAV